MQWGKDMVWDDQLLTATTHIPTSQPKVDREGEYVLDTPLLGPLVLVGVQANGDKKSWVS